MFAPYLMNAWITATIVALMAGTIGFFVVLRGNTFEAHTLPLGAFPGAAAATLLGLDPLIGLLAFSLAAVGGIALLARRDDRQVATALALVLLLGLGALLLSLTRAYAPAVFALLFGELLGVGAGTILPMALIGALSIGTTLALFRPLLLDTLAPELAAGATAVGGRRLLRALFLLDLAVVAAAALPVVGALLVFTLMVGPPAAARALTNRPLVAMTLSAALALATVWLSLALSFWTDWPIGFFVGMLGVVCYAAGRVAKTARAVPPASGGAPGAAAG